MADRKIEKAEAEFRNSVTLTEPAKVNRYFLGAPIVGSMEHDGTDTSTSAGATNIWHFVGGNYLYTVPIGTQTLTNPVAVTTGLDVAGDATDDDGRQIDSASSLAAGEDGRDFYTVGSGAFYAKLTCNITDCSEFDDIRFGFRLGTQAFTATQDNYTDVCGFKIVDTAVSTLGILNNAATNLETDPTAIADGTDFTLEVKVAQDGTVTVLKDDVSYPIYSAGTTALVMDAGDRLCMYWYHIKDENGDAGGIIWTALEHGYEKSRSSKTIAL